MKIEIGAYVTIITAIIAAFLTYRNQLRLRAFELFLNRRDSILANTEKFISQLYEARMAIDNGASEILAYKYIREFNYEGLILYHKAKGANFGETANVLLETFLHILQEPMLASVTEKNIDRQDWIIRTTNILTLFYGLAHSQVSKEVESIAFTLWGNYKRRKLGKAKIQKTNDEKEKRH